MAGCDHTTIVFKNGEWIDEVGYFNYEKEEYVSTIPFEYNRDGMIHSVRIDPFGNPVNIMDDIKWYRSEYEAVYERDGCDSLEVYRFPYNIIPFLKWHLGAKRKVCYSKEIGVYKLGDIEVYIWADTNLHNSTTYASFYKDSSNTYIVLGGYGHWENVYTHFMCRGYGDEFEKEMAYEAYEWLLDDVLREIAERITDDWDAEENVAMGLRKTFGSGLRLDSWYRRHWFEDKEEDE